VWALPAGLGAVGWLPALIRRRRAGSGHAAAAVPDEPPRREVRRLLRKPLAWQVTLFFALQSGGFYSTLAWLPSIFRSHGYSEAHAGVLLSVSLVIGTFTGLAMPTLAHRMRDQRVLVLACAILACVGWFGILLAPTTAAYLWVVILGLGQNAVFPLVMMMIVLRGGSVVTTQTLSAMAQSVGYALAALAPLAVGSLHGLTHSWTPEVILLLALILPQFLLGLGAGRDRQLAELAPADIPGSQPTAQPTTP
jgi:CP family cyanate transporter-like MFS transporter